MDIEKYIQSEEVREQSISQKEILSILNIIGVNQIPDNVNELKPYFVAFKISLIKYGINAMKEELLIKEKIKDNQEFNSWENTELSIFENTPIIDIINCLKTKLNLPILSDNGH